MLGLYDSNGTYLSSIFQTMFKTASLLLSPLHFRGKNAPLLTHRGQLAQLQCVQKERTHFHLETVEKLGVHTHSALTQSLYVKHFLVTLDKSELHFLVLLFLQVLRKNFIISRLFGLALFEKNMSVHPESRF